MLKLPRHQIIRFAYSSLHWFTGGSFTTIKSSEEESWVCLVYEEVYYCM